MGATEDKICENAKKLKTSWAEVEKACEKDFNVTKAELDQLKERQACIKAFGECRKGERTLPKEMKRCMPVCKSGNTTATPPKGGKTTPKGGNTTPKGGKTTPTKATTTGKTTPTKGKTTTGGKTTTAKGKTTTGGKTSTTGGKTTGPSASNAQRIAEALANALNALRAALGTTGAGRALVKRQTDANAKCAEIIKLV